ncbi:U3 small nucleolar RNA-associated protein 4 homolog [Zerene cesonia]|uniref:U3 small nucleolar RNA-associated protein 4 homolog n=1 Tax=Zerene cesonia TaxID=33412 RepID=UPI0018E53BFC|nr:U3 small nucleolar RNA-associated protein 4 homolog [Zerene cesonia]
METKVHRFRYYNPKPESIVCVSYNKTNKVLALARKNASIEIWDIKHAPFLLQFIPGAENASVEALGWVNERLLSTDLGGALLEWDLDKRHIKKTVMLTGYAAWCLDVNDNNTAVAVGTEQGYVNIYSVENDDIVYQKLFDKQEGRILCCKFDKTGNVLVTGSIDTIRVWNVNSGHATCRISCKRRGKEVIVWSVAILSDNVIVAGDSHGRLSFWDSVMGDQVESFATQKADILSVAISDDEKSLYCSGIDPIITMYVKVDNTGDQSGIQWVKNIQRNIHEHDVRALVVSGERLISVGADGYLTLSSYPPKKVMRIPPMIPSPRTSFCAMKKSLLLRYSNHLEVWQLGSYARDTSGKIVVNSDIKQEILTKKSGALENDTTLIHVNNHEKERSLKVTEEPIKLVSIQTKSKKEIICSEMAPNGDLIVYSTDSDIRMLKLDEDQGNISLRKVIVSGVKACDGIVFTEDSSKMIVHHNSELFLLQVDPDAGASVIHSVSTVKHLKGRPILHLVISQKYPQGYILAISNVKGDISVWGLKNKKLCHMYNVPKHTCVPSSMAIIDGLLVIVYVDQKVIEYDILKEAMWSWPQHGSIPFWTSRNMAAKTISKHPARNAYVFTDEVSIWTVEKTASQSVEPNKKKVPMKNNERLGVNVTPVKYLAGFHWIAEDEAVIVEVLPENIIMQLPPVMVKQRHNISTKI